MDNQNDKVLIITATSLGDRIPFILELKETIKNQTVDNWEWFIHIHGVSEDVFNHFNNLYAEEGKINFLYSQEKHEIFDARNKVVKHALSELNNYAFIMNVDDDDLLPPKSLENHLAAMKTSNKIGWTIGVLVDTDYEGKPYHNYHPPLPEGFVTLQDMRDGWNHHNNALPAASHMCMFRLSTFEAINGYPACTGDDIAIVINAARSGFLGYNHKQVIYYYRDWDGQVMKTKEFLEQDEQMRKELFTLVHKPL